MELIAAGRDCDVFDLGDGTVLRRKRDGRSLDREADVMRHVRAHGFPCPAVHRVDGSDLVLDLVPGPTMLADLLADLTVERATTVGETLARLHQQLHELPPLGATDDRLLHLDLHPDNVLLAPDGPVLIDWSNATDGSPPVDLAMTWLIITPFARTGLAEAVALLGGFLDLVGLDEARRGLGEAGRRRLADRNLLDHERVAVRATLDDEGVVL